MKFNPGDKVTVAGVITTDEWANTAGWCMVAFDGYRVLVRERDVALVDRMPTPGQLAYEAYWRSRKSDCLGWSSLGKDERATWEAVAEAARS